MKPSGADLENKTQRIAVLSLMADGKYRTLFGICAALKLRAIAISESSASARLRDLRKEQYGAWTVERRLVLGSRRLYEYRVTPAQPRAAVQNELFVVASPPTK